MKRNHQFLLLATVAILVIAFSSFSKGGKKKFPGYTKGEGNSYFLLHKKGASTIPIDTGGAVFVKMKFKTEYDSVFVDINQFAKTASYPVRVDKPVFKGDFQYYFLKLHIGDSASFFISLDSLKKYYPNEFTFEPKFNSMKYLGFTVKIDSIYTKEKIVELQAKAEAERQKQQLEQQLQQAEMQKMAALMKPIQDSARLKEPMLKEKDFELLSNYIKNSWKGPRNPDNDGIFYVETAAGVGEVLKTGTLVSLRYTGKYLDGTVFDSNNMFPEQQPMTFQLGDTRLISGFTKCISRMKIGTKAIFILPPRLGYNDGLTRIFEVEIVGAKTN